MVVSAPARESHSPDDAFDPPDGVKVGDAAPEFQGAAPSQIQGSKMQGELVLVYFWASWCMACDGEVAEIEKLYQAYGERGLEVVGVNIDGNRKDMQEFLATHPTTFLHFQDLKMVNVNTWEPRGMSAIYLVDRDAKVRFVHTASDHEGQASPDFSALERLIHRSLE